MKERTVGTIDGWNGTKVEAVLKGSVTMVFTGKDSEGNDSSMTFRRLANGTVKTGASGWTIHAVGNVNEKMVVSREDFAATMFEWFATRMARELAAREEALVVAQEQAYIVAERTYAESDEAVQAAELVLSGTLPVEESERMAARRLYELAEDYLRKFFGAAQWAAMTHA